MSILISSIYINTEFVHVLDATVWSKIGRKISLGGLIFVGKRYVMKITKISMP